MSMFTFAISCWPCPFTLIHWLNIPDSYQYCSLQNQTLLLPPDTSTNEPHFCFGPASSFFLELFFHSSPVAYWTHSTWELIFSPFMIFFLLLFFFFLPFHTLYGVLEAKILQWIAIPSSCGPCFAITLHRDLPILHGPVWHRWLSASLSFSSPFTIRLWSMKGSIHCKQVFFFLHSLYCLLIYMCVWSVAQSCLTIHNPMDCSLPGSSVPGIFQARKFLEWVVISRWPSQLKDQTWVFCVSCTDRQIL